MDITPQDNTNQSISDDQELAKALAGVLPDEPENAAETISEMDLQFEETPAPAIAVPPVVANNDTPQDAPQDVALGATPDTTSQTFANETPVVMPSISNAPASSSTSQDLEGIKGEALQELRPLMERVDLPAEEKFDTYLMLIRSTDDSSLVAAAHAEAQKINDEKRKAEALLEIIKEIDYLSKKDQVPTV